MVLLLLILVPGLFNFIIVITDSFSENNFKQGAKAASTLIQSGARILFVKISDWLSSYPDINVDLYSSCTVMGNYIATFDGNL